MLKFSEIFEFSKEKFRKILILKEFEWFEWFEWFGLSPIEPFNSGCDGPDPAKILELAVQYQVQIQHRSLCIAARGDQSPTLRVAIMWLKNIFRSLLVNQTSLSLLPNEKFSWL